MTATIVQPSSEDLEVSNRVLAAARDENASKILKQRTRIWELEAELDATRAELHVAQAKILQLTGRSA